MCPTARRRALRACAQLAILAVSAAPAAATAASQIEQISVASETRNQVTFTVVYTYDGSHGRRVLLSATPGGKSADAEHYGGRAALVRPGRNRAQISVDVRDRAPAVLSSDRIEVAMRAGGQDPFMERTYAFAKTWTQPGAALPPLLRVLDTPHAVLRPERPRLELLRPEDRRPGVVPDRQRAESAPGAPVRRVLPNGRVELRYPDGTVRERFRGGETVTRPDGTTQTYLYSSAQPPTPPSAPPDTTHALWLEAENARLLGIIRTLVGNHEPSIEHYLSQEGSDISPYERIDARTQAVDWLVRP